MPINHMIPEVWSAKILAKFRQEAIFAGLANREYEGEAAKGNTVHIPGIVDVTIKDYKAAGRTTTPDDIEDTGMDLLIDQEKSFDFIVDDIDAAQANVKILTAYTDSAAEGLKQDSDAFLAALLVAGGTAITPGAPVTNAATAWNALRDIRKAMNKAGVPQDGRVFVVNAEFGGFLDESDSKLMKANESATTDGLRNATYGKLLGMESYASENVPETDKPQIVAWHKSALAYVSQIQKTEGMRAEKKFADRVRGLHVYGGKLVRPNAAFHWTAA